MNTQKYINAVNAFVDTINDENKLNDLFVKITILRIKLDPADGIFQNFKDYLERQNSSCRNNLIKLQFNDICLGYHKYNANQKREIDSIMLEILPKQTNNSIWNSIKQSL